jgi:chromosome segregation ATPase
MYESYRGQQEDLAEFARRVEYFNEKKKRLRAQIEEAREQRWQASEIVPMEVQLATVGEDAQLANIDLQNALQRQQQTLQTMSNVSKMLHDTAMAIIRKIG